jgi:hypothetical protein
MTSAAGVPASVISPEETWSKSSFCSGMSQSRRRSGILAASKKLRNAVNDGIDLAEA